MRYIYQLSQPLTLIFLNLVQHCSCETPSLTSSKLSEARSILQQRRFLEDGDPNDGDNYDGDLSAFTIKQGHCFRMKIENNNDDDGNAYFYNGAYRSQYKRYISYMMCTSGTNTCSEYVVELNDYLEQTVPFVQNYCTACAASCRRQLYSNRNLEDANAIDVDCSSCSNDCKMISSNGNSGTDESDYIGCQAAADEENGMQYYTAPQCENDHIVIGKFYDDECTIKTTTSADGGFSYNTFATIEQMKLPCNADASETCRGLYESIVAACENGVAENADEDQSANSICKAAAASGRVYTYYKKPRFLQRAPIVLFVVAMSALVFLVGFLSYTYFVRHRRAAATIPMASLDGAPTTPLPNIS